MLILIFPNLLRLSHRSHCFTVECEVSGLREQLGHLKEEISGLESRVFSSMNDLRSELNLQVKNVDITRAEATVQFEVTDVYKFFEAAKTLRRRSHRFWCRGLEWSLVVKSKSKDSFKSRSLGFYVLCENNDQKRWSCRVDYKLILFSKLSGKNLVRPSSFNFERKSQQRGFRSFVSYDELTNEENGYIADGKIFLGVEMKAGPVIRG